LALHAGGISDRLVEPRSALVDLSIPVVLLVEFDHVRILPVCAGEDGRAVEPLVEGGDAAHEITHHRRVGENLLLPVIWVEGFALLAAEGLEHGDEEAVARFDRLGLQYPGQVLPVAQVARVLGTPRLATHRYEFRLTRLRTVLPRIEPVLSERRVR